MNRMDEKGRLLVEKKKPSVWPYYAAGGAYVLYGLIFPLYRWFDFLIALAFSAVVFIVLKKICKPQTVLIPQKEEPVSTGDKQADEILAQGQDYLRQIRASQGRIKDAKMQSQLGQMSQLLEKILVYCAQNPKRTPRIRKTVSYYLPTIVKLLSGYEDMQNQGIEGENISQGMQKTQQILATVCQAFEKQLDSLFADEALDMTTDMEVLEQMLLSEGLTTSDLSQGAINDKEEKQ